MSAQRRISFAFGALFLITFITSIPALGLFQPVLDDPQGYIAGAGADNRIYFGALLELILIVANIATAVVVFPLLKRQHEILSLGYVTARIMECVFILVGIIAVLAIVTLRHDAGADAAALGGLAESLAAIKDWTFLLGPSFVVGIGNGLILGYLMYKSGLMPRRLALLGMIGGPLLTLSAHRRALRPLRRGRAGEEHCGAPRDHLGALAVLLPADLGIQVVVSNPRGGGAPRPASCLERALTSHECVAVPAVGRLVFFGANCGPRPIGGRSCMICPSRAPLGPSLRATAAR